MSARFIHKCRMTPKQRAILDFLFAWFEADGGPISSVELAERLNLSPTGMGATMLSLQWGNLIEMHKDLGLRSMGSANVIMAVHHPEFGTSDVGEPVVFDDMTGCWRFESDIAERVTYSRRCLKCDQHFSTISKFIRFCEACKTTPDWQDSAALADQYISNGAVVAAGGARRSMGGFRSPEVIAFGAVLEPQSARQQWVETKSRTWQIRHSGKYLTPSTNAERTKVASRPQTSNEQTINPLHHGEEQ